MKSEMCPARLDLVYELGQIWSIGGKVTVSKLRLKCFDPLYYMANPRMCYTVQFLDKVDTSAVRSRATPSTDMANLVQRKMGEVLGYGFTMLTRKDKYLMLAGNDGIIRSTGDKSASTAPPGAATAADTGRKNKST